MLGIGHHHGGEGPERLLTVAGRLFAAKGFLGASVREILQAADVSRPVLYYHFGSKEGLYLAVARRAATDYEAALARAAEGPGTAAERIRRVCRVHASAVHGGTLLAVAAEAVPLAASDASLDPAVRPGRARVLDVVRRLVAEGTAREEFAACDPDDVALALVAGAELTGAPVACGSADPPLGDRLDRVLSVVLSGLTPAPRG
jgi:AcrR family transcriptional regulator